MAPSFKDYFSDAAADYAAFRPQYPDALFSFLASITLRRETAWDCAAGNGQAAVGLAGRFSRVIATDASAEQIAQAMAHPRVAYRVAPAEESGLETGAIDLVTVAQAVHWFDLPAFYPEVLRVLSPGGVIALWCYDLLSVTPEIDRIVLEYYTDTLAPYWPPERKLVEERYLTIDFPFDEFRAPPFAIESPLTLRRLCGYLRSWSATRKLIERQGGDPVGEVFKKLSAPWGDPATPRAARWPIHMRVGRKEPE